MRGAGLLSREEYFSGWAQLHGGYDPTTSWLVRTWLGWTYRLARPLAAARVPPDLLTLVGVLVSAAVVGVCVLGGRWVLLAPAVVVLGGLLDNLDGAVAVITGRASRWGSVLDSVTDRVGDLLFVLALWVVGAPGWWCVLGAASMLLQEYARARAGAVGMTEIGVVTVWERPTRVIVTAVFLLGAGLHVGAAEGWATAGAAAWVGLGAVGLGQLLVVVRRRLR